MGLFRDYERSDAIRMQLFEALVPGEGPSKSQAVCLAGEPPPGGAAGDQEPHPPPAARLHRLRPLLLPRHPPDPRRQRQQQQRYTKMRVAYLSAKHTSRS